MQPFFIVVAALLAASQQPVAPPGAPKGAPTRADSTRHGKGAAEGAARGVAKGARTDTLEQVVVRAVRAGGTAPVSERTLTHEELQRGYTGQDAPLLLMRVPPTPRAGRAPATVTSGCAASTRTG